MRHESIVNILPTISGYLSCYFIADPTPFYSSNRKCMTKKELYSNSMVAGGLLLTS